MGPLSTAFLFAVIALTICAGLIARYVNGPDEMSRALPFAAVVVFVAALIGYAK